MSERAWDRLLLGGLLAVGGVGVGMRFHDQLGLTGDNAAYLLLARNLATGQPYDNAGFPWGYPALLLPGVALFGPDHLSAAVPWLKLLTIGTFLVAIALFYRLFRLRHGPLLAGAASLIWIVNDVTLAYANDLMTELPYMAATAAALLWWQTRVERSRGAQRAPRAGGQGSGAEDQPAASTSQNPKSKIQNPKFSVLSPQSSVLLVAGLLLLLPYYLRTIGLVLLVAAPGVLAWHGRWRQAAGLAGGLALGLAPWLIYTRTAGLPNYFDAWFLRNPYNPAEGRIVDLGEFVSVGVSRLITYANAVLPAMLLPGAPDAAWVRGFSLLVLAAMALGWARQVVRWVALPEAYGAAFVLALGSWPWVGDRFLLPVLPLLAHYLMETVAWGATAVNSWWRRRDPAPARRGRLLAAGALLLGLGLLIAPNLARDAQAGSRALTYWRTGDSAWLPDMDAAWQRYFEACAWLRDHTPPGAVVLSRKSSLTTIYAGRPSLLIPLIPPPDYAAWLREHQVAYILEDDFAWSTHTTNFLRPTLQQYPARFRLVHTTPPPATRIWEVVTSDE